MAESFAGIEGPRGNAEVAPRSDTQPGAGASDSSRGEADFGFERVAESEKVLRVGAVFDRVADNYDVMNDLMSAGLHRLWKRFAVEVSRVRRGERVLDCASGSGDLALLLSRRGAQVTMTDINGRMLARGRDRMIDAGFVVPSIRCDAERLPFPSASFDCVTVGFGLRNMTRKDVALAEMRRVLAPGGRLVVLEFSRIAKPFEAAYDFYSFRVLPWLGQRVAGDANAYRYLAESIRVHPAQRELATLMERTGYSNVQWFNLAAGAVAVHRGVRLS